MPTPGRRPRFTVQPISAEQTHALRHSVLRPHQKRSEMVYPGDNLPATIHLGAFDRAGPPATPIGIASLYQEPMPATPEPGDYRLRGMAVARDLRGLGVGAQLFRHAIQAVADADGRRVWCNARVTAMGFYDRLGFSAVGKRFEIPGIGEHDVMWIAATRPSR